MLISNMALQWSKLQCGEDRQSEADGLGQNRRPSPLGTVLNATQKGRESDIPIRAGARSARSAGARSEVAKKGSLTAVRKIERPARAEGGEEGERRGGELGEEGSFVSGP